MNQCSNFHVQFDTRILIIFIKNVVGDISKSGVICLITANDPESTQQQKLELNFNFSS